MGISVTYRRLTGCDALLVGHEARAMVTVNRDCSTERQRFSLAHELGHWHYHRGQGLYCLSGDIDGDPRVGREPELTADHYASSLLMPTRLFVPFVDAAQPTWKHMRSVASAFSTSLVATALRMSELSASPLLFVVAKHGRRQWFHRGPAGTEAGWFPTEALGAESAAFDLSFRAEPARGPRRVPAHAWFDGWTFGGGMEIMEDAIRVGDSAYALLWPTTGGLQARSRGASRTW
ncbi:ImmA/IrrE family metallo-endopeptidase [Luteibacter jiangsuensis]|uniref:ImmA/IrrE family metallo-endopeptidase n=1 Tax=Luteibacter jiangsuensis TaxID=637577 RepID=UPI003D2F70B8